MHGHAAIVQHAPDISRPLALRGGDRSRIDRLGESENRAGSCKLNTLGGKCGPVFRNQRLAATGYIWALQAADMAVGLFKLNAVGLVKFSV